MNLGISVNDIHSGMNATRVARVAQIRSEAQAAEVVTQAANSGVAVTACGGRHAMGGQQFGEDTVLLDMSALASVGSVDSTRGLVECGAGVTWPSLIRELLAQQQDNDRPWTIRQKQTGADRLSIGGALAANIHGRGLKMRPFVEDIESFNLVDASGLIRRCSRSENTELFRLAIGGYGLLGVVTSVCLRLSRRLKLERIVEIALVEDLMAKFESRIADGFLFGDFQFAIDERSTDFLRRGIFSCYRPAPDKAVPEVQRQLNETDWERLVHLAHADRAKVYEEFASYYLSTNGQAYWSDTHQLSVYIDDYHSALDRRIGASTKATEMITELYVPRSQLAAFMLRAACELRSHGLPVIYGTVRLIERDEESFLAWAREDWACVVFNLHVEHTCNGIESARAIFSALIDTAQEHGGSYYLTYHRWATCNQLARCYPRFREFVRCKERQDPAEIFQSNWWRHYRKASQG